MSTRSERRRRREKQERALRISDTPEQRRITAYHESSHAVLAELCEFPVEYVTCLPSIASANHPEALRARRMGAVLVKAGGTQLVLTDGAVPLPFPERSFFYILGRLASLPTEKRLGVSDENAAASCSGDTEGVKQTMKLETGDAEEDAKRAMMLFGVALLAGLFVCHTRVWQAIEQTAGLLLQKGKIQGEEVRQIVRQHIPEHIFFSEERQRNIWQEGGPPVAIMKALQEEQAKEAA